MRTTTLLCAHSVIFLRVSLLIDFLSMNPEPCPALPCRALQYEMKALQALCEEQLQPAEGKDGSQTGLPVCGALCPEDVHAQRVSSSLSLPPPPSPPPPQHTHTLSQCGLPPLLFLASLSLALFHYVMYDLLCSILFSLNEFRSRQLDQVAGSSC